MVIKLFPTKDSTIYSLHPYRNTGLDEILELSLQNNTLISTGNNTEIRPEASRILIQFDPTTVTPGAGWKAYLKLFLAKAGNIPADFSINCYPVSGAWDMGTGRWDSSPETQNGVSWNYRTQNDLWSITGSTYYTSSVSSQSFSYYSTKDIELDVTNIVNLWLTGSINNDGFVVKNNTEFVTSSIYEFKFFSRDTHTIYPPCLEFRWNDSSFVTGSGSVITNDKVVLTLGDNKSEYYEDSIQRFRINVRDRFPTRAFQTSSVYLNNKFLPSQSYWALKDLNTDEFVINFDTGSTIISCDGTASYFDLNMGGLEPERNYKFLFKTTLGSQTVIFDDRYYFKVKK